MKERKIAKVWAEALLETARERKALDAAVEGVRLLQALFDELPSLVLFIASPRIPEGVKKERLDAALTGSVDAVLLDFLGLVMDRRRGIVLPDILEAFVELHREAAGIAVARVRTAEPLSDALRKKVAQTLQSIFGRTIELDAKVDEGLLGGAVIQVGDTRFDSSLRRDLDEIARRMRATRLSSEVIYADQD